MVKKKKPVKSATKAKPAKKAKPKAKPATKRVTVTRAKPASKPKTKAKPAKKATPKKKPSAAARKPSKPQKRPVKRAAKPKAPRAPKRAPKAPKRPAKGQGERPKPKSALPANLESLFQELKKIRDGEAEPGETPTLDDIISRYVPKQKSRIEKKQEEAPPAPPKPKKPAAPKKQEEREPGDELGDWLANDGWGLFEHANGYDAEIDFGSTDEASDGIPSCGVTAGVFWRAYLYVYGDSDGLASNYLNEGLDYDPGQYDSGSGDWQSDDATERKTIETGWHSDPAVLKETIDTVASNMQDLGWSVSRVTVTVSYRQNGVRPK